ncbi:MAG: hypothetical protein AAF702_33405 [Chloroflexota bacterium]
MFQPTMRKLTLTCLMVLLLTPLLALKGDWVWSQPSDGSVHLAEPPFLNVAQAQGTTFADNEAGIAAYFNAGSAIDINSPNLQPLYRSPTTPSEGYLLGSAIVSETHPDLDYDANDDVKLYISADGWVMAYYPRGEPTSKIFDLLNWDGGGVLPTKLEQVLGDTASKISAPQPTPTYYHFAFPNANHMMLIADEHNSGAVSTNSFNFTPPNEFEYFQWSWALASLNIYRVDFSYELNGTEIVGGIEQGVAQYDNFSSPQPNRGQTNTATIRVSTTASGYRGAGGLAVIYKVP